MKIACAGVSVTGSAGQMVTPHAARMPLLVLHAAELAEELGQSFSRRLVVKTGRVVWNNWLLLLHTAKSPLVQPMPMPCPDPNPR